MGRIRRRGNGGLEREVLFQMIDEDYAECSDQRLIGTTAGRLRLDALLAALVKR